MLCEKVGALLVEFAQVRDMWAATKARESANREAFDADRIKYEEEIASLRRIIEGGCDLKALFVVVYIRSVP